MSRYEMLDYDDLLNRIGITPGQTWFCGDNPPSALSYQQAGMTYDALAAYAGSNQLAAGGLCLTEDVNVNGLLLNHRDRNGTIWLCTDIEGWWTLPPSEIPDVPKPYWDGSMLTTGRYLTRTITISGCFIPPNPSLVWYNRDAILRVSSIVRGVGLLAMCGNQSLDITMDSEFFDAPKMAIIQMNDVPLVDTIRPNGFTQFSLSFKSVQPTKHSLYEKSATLPVEVGAQTRTRVYKSFSQSASEEQGAGSTTTAYRDLVTVSGSAGKRTYGEVEFVNLDSLIKGEEIAELTNYDHSAYITTNEDQMVVLHNAGNYFAFPIFVFKELRGVSKTSPLTLRNLTTGEVMRIQQSVTLDNELVVDTGLRRVGQVDPDTDAVSWSWDDRGAMSLTSQWVSLAPGDNVLLCSAGPGVTMPILPTVYWRDTWIG
jgi:hypothetical protein